MANWINREEINSVYLFLPLFFLCIMDTYVKYWEHYFRETLPRVISSFSYIINILVVQVEKYFLLHSGMQIGNPQKHDFEGEVERLF